MAKNYVCEGDRLDYTNTTGVDIKSGDPVLVGDTLGVAYTDIPNELTRTVMLEGVYVLPKATGVIPQGAKVYYDANGDPVGGTAGTGALTSIVTDNVYAGIAYAAAANGDATVQIKLNA